MIGIELHVPDFYKVRQFYFTLGFKLSREEPNYLVLNLNNNILNFYGGSNDIYNHKYFSKYERSSQPGYGVEIIITLNDLHEIYTRAQSLDCIETDLQVRPWGAKDFRIKDPYGYYLRLTTSY